MNSIIKKVVSIILIAAFIIAILPQVEIFAADITYSGGAGTKNNPYLVSTMQDLLNVEYNSDKYFLQTCDISMAGRTFGKNPISSFSGTYDGGGYAISDLKIENYDETNGLFGLLFGTIKNVNVKNCDVSVSFIYAGDGLCGAIAGRIYASGKVIGCSVSGKIYARTNSSNTEKYIGGITGVNQGEIKDCVNSATITIGVGGASDMYAGGIVGNNNATVENCCNEGKIEVLEGRNALAAGIAAINFGTVSSVKNIADVYSVNSLTYEGYSSDSYAAGIAAYNKGTVSYAENSGLIKAESTADNAEAGGITAYTGGSYSDVDAGYTVEKSKNSGEVIAHSTAGESCAGGITGTCYKDSYVRYCCNTGNVCAAENKLYNIAIAGGVAGCLMYGTMMQSCNHGDVTVSATQYDAIVCGVANTTSAVMVDCYNDGDVYVNNTPVRYSYGTGAGIFKDSDTTCINCYNLGNISAKYGANRRYGLYGLDGGTDRNSVYNCFTTCAVNTQTKYVITAEQAVLKETYTGYNFESVWNIDPALNGGHPYLRNIPGENDPGWYTAPEDIVSVTGVNISNKYLIMKLGQTVKLIANVIPENAKNRKITWSSSNKNKVTVDQTGRLTAVASGYAVIYATTADGSYKASCTVTVSGKTPSFSGGSGTAADPYLIATAEDLVNVVYKTSAYYKQIANISMEGTEFIPIGNEVYPFSGNYNGDGFNVSDLTLKATDTNKHLGIFGYSSGTVTNVKLKNITIENNSSSGTIYSAGLVAYNTGTIKNCHVNADVSSLASGERNNAYAGGVVGYSTKLIESCSFSGTVFADVAYLDCFSYVGGIVAYGAGVIASQNYGDISAKGDFACDVYAGGIAGYSSGQISRCYNGGSIRAEYSRRSFAGGISGHNYSNVSSCKNDGEVYASTSFNEDNDDLYSLAGGISASNYGNVNYCKNYGTVHSASTSSHAYAGGIVGYNNSSAYLQSCKNYGDVKAGSLGGESRAGGIASSSYKNSIVRYCCNNGNVEIYDNPYYWYGCAGGVVAVLQYGTVTQCCNHGDVTIDSSAYEPYGCGIAGFTDATLTDCYSDGDVISKFRYNESYNKGMICGIGDGCGTPLKNCYFAGELVLKSGSSSRYGLIWTNGQGGNSMTGCYTLNLYSSTESANKITAEASKLQATYSGYDFTSVWEIDPNVNEGRPYLRNIPSDSSSMWYSGSETQTSLDGHVGGDWVVTTEPTCYAEGVRQITCVTCGRVLKSEAVSKVEHKFADWVVSVEPTCESSGEKYRYCEVCDEYEFYLLEMLGHDLVHHEANIPTCTEIGWNAYDTCQRCDYTTYKVLPAKGHSYESAVTLPTCTEQGYATHTCACGHRYIDSYTSPTGHSYGDWTIINHPVCEYDGEQRRDCKNCDYYETEVLKKLGHDLKRHEAKIPTCTEVGWDAYDTCSRCDYHTFVVLPETGHNYESTVTPPTDTEQGYTTHTCSQCGDSYVDSYTDPLYRRGDLNRDGSVDIDDVLLCLDLVFVTTTKEQLKLADFDETGVIDVDDVLICLELCFDV